MLEEQFEPEEGLELTSTPMEEEPPFLEQEIEEELPPEFQGKSAAEIARCYQELAREAQVLKARLEELSPEEAFTPEQEDFPYDLRTQERILPLYSLQYQQMLSGDRAMLERLGCNLREVEGYLLEGEEQRRAAAWQQAHMQAAYYDALARAQPPQDSPTPDVSVDRDVRQALTSHPVSGVEVDEVVRELSDAIRAGQVPLEQWSAMSPEAREQYIYFGALQMAYDRLTGGEAPPQQAPGVLGRGYTGAGGADPAVEEQITRIMTNMGLSRADAEAVVKGAER